MSDQRGAALARRAIDAAHAVLIMGLVALRPLIWDGEAGAGDQLVWLAMVLVALLALLLDGALARSTGAAPAWRWGWGGVAAGVLLVALLPAALRSPQHALGLGLWGSLALHLGFACYLLNVIRGRERLVFAALCAGLAGELLVAHGQWRWVLPELARLQAEGSIELGVVENRHGDLAARIAGGGLFGTFTLANTLAAYLLLALPPLAGALATRAWRGPRTAGGPLAMRTGHGPRVAGALLLLAGLLVFAATSSKGAVAALAGGGLLLGVLHARGRLRLACALAGLVVAALVLIAPLRDAALAGLGRASPGLRDGLVASGEVRVGYWRAALALIGEAPLAGHGLGGFATHVARVLPPEAEYSRYVHNEALDIAVDAGLPAAALLIALFALLLRRPAPPAPPGTPAPPPPAAAIAAAPSTPTAPRASAAVPAPHAPAAGHPPQAQASDHAAPHAPAAGHPPHAQAPHHAGPCAAAAYPPPRAQAWAPAALLLLVPYVHAFGMLSFASWPGSGDAAFSPGWALAVGLVMAIVAALAGRLAPPPAWALRFAIAAFALHCLVDFDLHSSAIWGTLIVVACLGARAEGPPLEVGRGLLLAAGTVVAASAVGLVLAGQRASDLRRIADIAYQLRASQATQARRGSDPVQARLLLRGLAWLADQEDPPPGLLADPAAVRRLHDTARDHAWQLARRTPLADVDAHLALLTLQPPGTARLPRSRTVAADFPASAFAAALLAEDLAPTDLPAAIAEQRRALALAPWTLAYHRALAVLLRRAAAADPARAPTLTAEATAIETRMAALDRTVHFRNRL